AEPLGTPALLLVAAGFLMLGLVLAWLLVRIAPDRPEAAGALAQKGGVDRERIGGSAWAGFGAVFRSRYLTGIAGYIQLTTVVATFIYFTRLQMVAAVADDLDARTEIFANIDMWTQIRSEEHTSEL